MLKIFLAFYLLVPTLQVLKTDHHVEDKRALVLNDVHWPPFLFSEKDSAYPGFAKEILSICFALDEYNPTYLNLPVKRTHLFMRSGEVDISLYSYKPEREDFVHFNKVPIFVSEYGFAVAKDSDVEIKSLSDLRKYTIGHLSGLTHTPELMEIIEDNRLQQKVLESNDVDIMIRQLLSNPPRVDIIPNSKETFLWRAKEQNLTDQIEVLDFTLAYKPYFLAVSKNSKNIVNTKAFLASMDQCLFKLQSSNVYRYVGEKYGLFQ